MNDFPGYAAVEKLARGVGEREREEERSISLRVERSASYIPRSWSNNVVAIKRLKAQVWTKNAIQFTNHGFGLMPGQMRKQRAKTREKVSIIPGED